MSGQRKETSDSSSIPARYELMVDGRIGPVFRCALKSHGGGTAQVCLVMRASGPEDLVGLMQVLEAHGLEVNNVSRLPTTAPDG
jgi:hypothetical protein